MHVKEMDMMHIMHMNVLKECVDVLKGLDADFASDSASLYSRDSHRLLQSDTI